MDPLKAKLNYYLSQTDKELTKYPQVLKLEQITGVPKTYLAVGVVGIVLLSTFFNLWGALVSNIIGWLYPAYASFKAIESDNKTDDTQWLTYWSVFGFVNIIEFFSDLIIYWVPFYFLFKTLFCLWLFLPPFKGAQVLYTKLFRPALLSHESDIDKGISKLKSKASDIVKEVVDAGLDTKKDD